MFRFNKTLTFVFTFLVSISFASLEYYHSLVDDQLDGFVSKVEQAEQSEKIEDFLQSTVPGLSATYRDVIDALIEDGQQVYLTGGVVRDLLSQNSIKPHDVDLDYSGTADRLVTILESKGWMYTRRPNRPLVIIGDHRVGSIDAMSIRKDRDSDEHNLEFTINNIFYHCNERNFTPNSELGLNDLSYSRLNIVAKNWKIWLYQPPGSRYNKIFRFWKMVGKGFIYSTKLDNFISNEIEQILADNPEDFYKELRSYLSKHMHSYEEIRRGSSAILGHDWTEEHLVPLREEALKLEAQFDIRKEEYTYYP